MIELKNDSRYIQPNVLNACFSPGKTNYVDKVICGNGFSTAFMNEPPPPGMINIIIAPNRAVVTGKEAGYYSDLPIIEKSENFNRTKFFYKNSKDFNFDDADLLMFVSDSFLLYKNKIEEIQDKIYRVLIDEAHSVEIQSSFRYTLINFENKVRAYIGGRPALTSVTATPNLFTNVSHQIINKDIPEATIYLAKDRRYSINKIRKKLENGEKVVVATNNQNVIYRLQDYNTHTLEARFIIGDTLMGSISELVKIIPNEASNLTIISSRGFEGFDIYGKDYSVFFFEDRSKEYERFYIANLYQAINRVRGGAKYIEYVRKDLSDSRTLIFKDIDKEIYDFINRKDISIYKKQQLNKEAGYYKFHPFVQFDQNKDTGEYTIRRNEAAIDLYKETLLYDKPFPSDEFKKFLEDRKITIVDLKEQQQSLQDIRLKDEFRIDRLKSNEDLITELDLFGDDYTLYIHPHSDNYMKLFNRYLRRKNYDQKRGFLDRELISLKLLSTLGKVEEIAKRLSKEYSRRSIDKYGKRQSKPWRDSFEKKSVSIVLQLIQVFTNEIIVIPSKWIANRDYNILTELGVEEIKLVASYYDVKITEVDINSAFARILYALNGLELPEDFYGVDKKDKLKINIFLNNFFYDPKKSTPRKQQKQNAKNKFNKLGFHPKVTDYLLTNFFDRADRGSLFHFLTFFEKKLISRIKKEAIEDFSLDGVGRRHDSLLLFNNKSSVQAWNCLDFLGLQGWFILAQEEAEQSYKEWYEKEIKPQKER